MGAHRLLWHRCLVVVIAAALYLPSLSFDFVYDDFIQIVLNPTVVDSFPSVASIKQVFFTPTPPGNLYRPLTTLTYVLNFWTSGLDPFIFHLTNIIIYGLICLAVYELFRALFGVPGSALAGAIIFAVHPIHVEAVANIIGRAEMVSTLGVLVTLLLFLKIGSTTKHLERIALSVIASAVFLLAVLSKESALTAFPLLIMVPWAVYRRPESNQGRLWALAPASVMVLCGSLASLLLRFEVLGSNFVLHQDSLIWPENPIFNLRFVDRIVPSFATLGEYLTLLALPQRLSADYSCMPDTYFSGLFQEDGFWSLVAFSVSVGFLYAYRHYNSIVVLGWWVPICFASTINLFVPIGTLMGERLAFLPSCGFIGFVVGIGSLWFTSTNLRLVAASFYIGVLTMISVTRIPVWQSNAQLFKQTIVDNPVSPKAYYNYGVHLFLHAPDRNEAEPYFRKAIEIHPSYVVATRAMADLMLKKGDAGRLEYWYLRLLKLTPNDDYVRMNLEKLRSLKEARTKDRLADNEIKPAKRGTRSWAGSASSQTHTSTSGTSSRP